MLRAAIYCRLSEEDRNKPDPDGESGSIRNQKALLLQYAAENNWEVYNLYSDDDYTGSDRNRPAFQRLLTDAEARRFDIVLCKSQSRFTRELELVEKYIHGLFPLWGVRFIGVADHADTDNKGNKKARQINGLVNEWYLEDLSENIRSVLTNRRQNGYHIGSFAPYGYRKDPEQKGRLLVDEEAAAVVREVFALYAQGHGKSAIARMLNDRGIPNPTEYKRLHGLRYRQPADRNSTLWRYPAIASMLANEVYIGNLVQGRYGSVSYKTKQNRPRPRELWYRVEGTHEPIVDHALWDRVQRIISERAKPFTGGEIGLFAGKARCAYCGYAMRSTKSRGRRYLQCASRYAAKGACVGAFIAVDRLEELVRAELERICAAYVDQEALERLLSDSDLRQPRRAAAQREVDVHRQRLSEYERAVRSLYLDRARGLLSEEDFAPLFRDLSAGKEESRRLLRLAERQLAEDDASAGDAACLRAQIERYTHPERLSRDMVDVLIDHILIGRRTKGERDPRIVIMWDL